MKTEHARDAARRLARRSVFEPIVPPPSQSFVWRCDDYPQDWSAWNHHPEYEIHLIRKSEGVALVGDHIGRFAPGYLAIVGSGLPHDWVTTVGPGEQIAGRDIVLQFDAARLRQAAAAMPELHLIETLLARALRGMSFLGRTKRCGAHILEAIGEADGLARLSLFLRLLHLLAASQDYELLSSETFAPDLAPDVQTIIQQVLKYLIDNISHDIRLADLAALAGMTESSFSRFFKSKTGNTLIDHLSKLRVNRACDLLAGSSLPITQICFEVGYRNISNFNRVFRSQQGMTPSLYRRLSEQRRLAGPRA